MITKLFAFASGFARMSFRRFFRLRKMEDFDKILFQEKCKLLHSLYKTRENNKKFAMNFLYAKMIYILLVCTKCSISRCIFSFGGSIQSSGLIIEGHLCKKKQVRDKSGGKLS